MGMGAGRPPSGSRWSLADTDGPPPRPPRSRAHRRSPNPPRLLLARLHGASSATRSSSTASAFGGLVVRVQPDAWRRTAQFCKQQLGCDYLSFVSGIDWMPTPDGRRRRFGRHVGAGAAEGDDVRRRRVGGPLPGVRVRRVDASARARAHVQDRRRRRRRRTPSRGCRCTPAPTGTSARRGRCTASSFDGHPSLRHLYLPSEFEGHPLRKDFPLLAREVKPWPGLVDVEPMPGDDAPTKKPRQPRRRRMTTRHRPAAARASCPRSTSTPRCSGTSPTRR